MSTIHTRVISGSTMSSDSETVRIAAAEYDELVQIARQFANLRQNLLNGGVDTRTIELLSGHSATQDSHNPPPRRDTVDKHYPIPIHNLQGGNVLPHIPGRYASAPQESRFWVGQSRRNGSRAQHYPTHGDDNTSGSQDGSYSDDSIDDHTGQSGLEGQVSIDQIPQPRYQRNAMRSVQLYNLPEGVTHADITAVVRGGLLLDIFVRTRDKTASLSFLHEEQAQAFHDHVRKYDLYVGNKRAEVKWNDRQYILVGHVGNKICGGATRNLVIRNCDPNHTEQSIREDLEHIHNLIVVRISFIGNDCFIGTNSVANAMYARTCMMSRLKYKNSRLEWDADECAQSLDRMTVRRKAAPISAPPKKPLNPLANRFQLLDMDGGAM